MRVYKSDYKLDSWSDGCDYGWKNCHKDIKKRLSKIPSLEFVDWEDFENNRAVFSFSVDKNKVGKVISELLTRCFIPVEFFKEEKTKAYFSFDLH